MKNGSYWIIFSVLAVVAYATYIHGYALDSNVRLPLYYALEIIPWWIPGTYIFLPVYWLMGGINHLVPKLSAGLIIGILVIIQLVYVGILAWILTKLPRIFRRRKNPEQV
jgi:hypothetical protein